jgi:hypothetical protein
MQSKATTVAQYLASLPADRRAVIAAVRQVILQNLDADFEEGIQCGMIGYYVPHRVHPAGYHCDPRQSLPFAALASQKNYMSLYMMMLYGGGEFLKRFEQGWAQTGKKLDKGKSCLRFKKLDDLALDVIGQTIKSITAKQFVVRCLSVTEARSKERSQEKAKARRTAKKKAKPATGAKRASVKKPAKRAKAAKKKSR